MPAQVFDLSSYFFSAFSIPTLITAAAILFVGFLVLARERISMVTVSFFLAVLSVSIWLFCFSWMYMARNADVAIWWAKAAHLGIPFIAPAIHQFTLAVLGIFNQYKRLAWFSWFVSAFFAVMFIGGNVLLDSVYPASWGYYPRYTLETVPFVAFFFAMLIVSLWYFSVEYRRAQPGVRKQRIAALRVAFAVGYIGTIDFVAAYNVPLYPIGYIPILAFTILAARVILSYRLVDVITPAFAAQQIIETMTGGLLVFDVGGVVRLVNQAACDLYGLSKEELLGRPIRDILGDKLFLDDLEGLVQSAPLRNYEISYTTPRGEKRAFLLAASVIHNETDMPAAVVSVARDITDRKQAEEQVRQQKEYLAALHETSLGLMNRLDLSDLLEAIILRAASLVGTTHGYVYVVELGSNRMVVQAGVGIFRQNLGFRLSYGEGLAGRVWETGEPMSVDNYADWSSRAQSLDYMHLHSVAGVPLKSGAQVVGVLGLAYDEAGRAFGPEEIDILRRFAQLASIALDNAQLYSAAQQELAERKLVEEEIRQLNEQLERRVVERTAQLQEAVQAREGLLSIVSHDLGNPLSIIKASVKMMQKPVQQPGSGDSTALARGLNRIDDAVTRMTLLINDLTDFARLQAGQPLDLDLRTTDLVALTHRVVAEYQQTTERHHIKIAGEPEHLLGLWDAARLERVLDNLLSNAIKYSPQSDDIIITMRREMAVGGRQTTTSLAAMRAGGDATNDGPGATDGRYGVTEASDEGDGGDSSQDWAVLVVQDKGIGIPGADLPHIFEWFHRAENTAGRIKGTGIGLASARQIVGQHGGTLTVQSIEGEGSTFTVRLPLSALER